MSITGDRDDRPTPQAVSVVDQHSATYLAFGILAALYYRERTGEGQRVEGDLLSAAVDLQLQELSVYANTGAPIERGERGLGNDMIQRVDHPVLGEVTVTGMPIRFSETPSSVRRHPPTAGEHTDEVLERLGYDLDE